MAINFHNFEKLKLITNLLGQQQQQNVVPQNAASINSQINTNFAPRTVPPPVYQQNIQQQYPGLQNPPRNFPNKGK